MRIATDVGGTFTDYVTFESGELKAYKALTTKNPSEGILDQLMGKDIQEFSHGTTIAVNTLLERNGAPVIFFTTRGFKDLINIGRQSRINVYSLIPKKPELPLTNIIRVTERTTFDGNVLTNIYDQELDQAGILYGEDDNVAVIGFINSYANPENEQTAEKILNKYFAHVFTSHKIRREIREYERFSTAVIEGYCAPIVNDYLKELELLSHRFYIMQSNGGKNYQKYMRAVNMIMSGPAGGVAATEALCKKLNIDNAIAYDMGGTSVDVSAIVNGSPQYTDTINIDGIPIKSLAIDIESIGAGGGSIAWIDDGGALKVGPMSAGSNPGPACYGRGGTDFTVSDANLILGVLGNNISEIALNINESKTAAKPLCKALGLNEVELSSGVVRIVNNNMVSAIKRISVSRGYDPRKFTLVAFGGAGPMHACAIADALRLKQIIIPPYAGAFSALGIMSAPIRFDFVRTILSPLENAIDLIPKILNEFYDELKAKHSYNFKKATNHESVDMRYQGQGHEINVTLSDLNGLAQAFHNRHEAMFGFNMLDNPIEVVNVKLVSESPTQEIPLTKPQEQVGKEVKEQEHRDVYPDKRVSVFRKDFFGSSLEGPCIIEDDTSTIYVATGWNVKLTTEGLLMLERV